MSGLRDDQIAEALNAYEADERLLVGAMTIAGVEATGDAVADVKALAQSYNVDVDVILYGLFDENSPLYRVDEE